MTKPDTLNLENFVRYLVMGQAVKLMQSHSGNWWEDRFALMAKEYGLP